MVKKQKNEETKEQNNMEAEIKEVEATEEETIGTEEVAEKPKKAATKKSKTASKEVKKDKAEPRTAKKELKTKNKLSKSEKKHSKKYREAEALIEKDKEYSIDEAIALAKKTTTTKFDSSLEIHISLGIDMKKADQQVRGSLVLPNGTGKDKTVVAIVGPDKEKEAKEAGALEVGGAELVDKIVKGWTDFDVIVATPDMMAVLGKAAKVLGPKGLMPNPKIGTVTPDPAKTIKNVKGGMVEYRADVYGIVHQAIGKVSFDDVKLKENYEVLFDTLKKVKPTGAKGTYLKSIYITTTMGPSIKVAV